jgi:FKBP-type peptidyl-prolyl cis-trans isomerase FkpA
MKKLVFLLLAIPFVFTACSKSDTNGCNLSELEVTAPAAEIAAVQAYLTANSITAAQHPSGFFYSITAPGSGATASLCSVVTVKYAGRLVNGTLFDSHTPATGAQFQLAQLIAGWQKGIPLIQKGGKIKLYIPPSLGYGPNPVLDRLGNVSIPGNSILIFDIELVEVQ